MEYVALGKSNLLVSRTAFGAMGLGDIDDPEIAKVMVKKAYEAGVNFFDVSCESPESERRLGACIEQTMRKNVYIATKTQGHTSEAIAQDLDMSLRNLNTEYIDLYQLEKMSYLPKRGGEDGIVEKLINLKEAGVIKHIGLVTDNMEIALEALESDGPWETIQYPFNMACDDATVDFVNRCADADIGFIAMRPLFSGILTNLPLALGYLMQFLHVVPVWGVTNEDELQQVLYFTQNRPKIDEKFIAEVEEIRNFFN